MMSPPTSAWSVVLLDVDRTHRVLTERALREAVPTAHCVSFSRGDDVIRHFDRGQHQRGCPELLLLGWHGTGRSGPDVLAWARAQPHLDGLPIVVLSGIASPENHQLATRLGADGYLLKPVHATGYPALAQELSGWRGRPAKRATPLMGTAPECSELPFRGALRPGHWQRGAHILKAVLGSWRGAATTAPKPVGSHPAVPGVPAAPIVATAAANPTGETTYIDSPGDQLTHDLVRLCRAQGIVPRDILRTFAANENNHPGVAQRWTVIRGLAKRGWDSNELAELFPLSPTAIRQLVRRRG